MSSLSCKETLEHDSVLQNGAEAALLSTISLDVWLRLFPLSDLPHNLIEGLVDICLIFGRGLESGTFPLLLSFLQILSRYFAFILQIAFVSRQHDGHIWIIGVCIQYADDFAANQLRLIKRLLGIDGIYNQKTISFANPLVLQCC